MKDTAEDPTKKQERELFDRAADSSQDAEVIVLRVHLLSEQYLERLIQIFLPRGDRILENANFTYYQKLTLVSSFDVLNDKTVQCLKGLNRLRNQCAHGLDKKITMSDVEVLGRPLGKLCTQYRRVSKNVPELFLLKILSYTCGHLAHSVLILEEEALKGMHD
jgi:hypothetical protein